MDSAEIRPELGGQRVVLKGLAAGERVIVDGLQRVRADAEVVPKEVSPAADAAQRSESVNGTAGPKEAAR